jgi:hypothetical protein
MAMSSAFGICILSRLTTGKQVLPSAGDGGIVESAAMQLPEAAIDARTLLPSLTRAAITSQHVAYVSYRPRLVGHVNISGGVNNGSNEVLLPAKVGFDALFYAQPADAAAAEAAGHQQSSKYRELRTGGVLLILRPVAGATPSLLTSCAVKSDAVRANGG